jgi:hypothetical protein
MQNTQNKGKAQVDFNSSRGFGLMGVGLPDDFLTAPDPRTALATIAFVYTHPDPTRVNSYGQAMATLALYGAGSKVFLTTEQYSELDGKVAEYDAIMRAPGHGHPRNEAFAAFVRAQAALQHSLCGSHTGGKARLDFESGRGFGPVGADLPDAFLRLDRACVLSTIALMFTHPSPMRVNKPCQAVTMMALYGAGAVVDLSKQQYRRLETAVREYESYMRAPAPHDQPRNESFARFARRAAESRAKSEGVI